MLTPHGRRRLPDFGRVGRFSTRRGYPDSAVVGHARIILREEEPHEADGRGARVIEL